jgi:transcriptional regulator with XRE-family HTH domain
MTFRAVVMRRETFGEYVTRVMRQKGLGATDVERKSGNKIDRSHVSKIMRGVETNPSAKAMMALAAGLGVGPHEIFTAVTGCPPDESQANAPDVREILSMMERVAMDSELADALRGFMRIPEGGRAAVARMLELSYEEHQQASRRGRRGKRVR